MKATLDPTPCFRSKPGSSLALRLRGNETFSTDRHTLGARLAATDGLLWITQEGDRVDYLVGHGETFVATRRGRLVAETVTPSAHLVFTPGRG